MKKLITLILAMAGMVSTASAYDHLYVAGVTALTGSDTAWTTIELTDDDGDGVYTYTTTKTLTAGEYYSYKYVLDSDWESANSGDRSFSVQANGSYLITFSINKANAESYDNKYYACDTWAIYQPTSVTFKGQGVTSNTWGDDTGAFTKDGNSWIYSITETIDNVYFHFIMDETEYGISSNKWFNPTDGWSQDMNTWSDYVNQGASFSLSPLTSLDYSKYQIKITPYHNNIYMEVSAYVKATTNSEGYCTLVNSNALKISDATAYYATDDGTGSATAIAITYPAKNTPMLIKGSKGKDYYFEVNSDAGYDVSSTNALHAGTGGALGETDGGGYNYILKGDAFYLANGNKVATNKAYLKLTQAATGRALKFIDNEETGINAVTTQTGNANACYNLSGQRVANPTKGLYIRGGKKVMVK